MKKALIIAWLLILVTASVGQAGVVEWKIDPDHTALRFSIRHIVGQVTGEFEKFGGFIRVDPENPDQSKISVVIDTKSIHTAVEQRDNHLRTADFFDADWYPIISFEGDQITHVVGNEYQVRGRLTIKDVTRDVVIPFTLAGVKPHPHPDMPCTDVAGVKATLKINRLDYNVGDGKFAKMGMVGEDVEITIFMEALSQREGCKK